MKKFEKEKKKKHGIGKFIYFFFLNSWYYLKNDQLFENAFKNITNFFFLLVKII